MLTSFLFTIYHAYVLRFQESIICWFAWTILRKILYDKLIQSSYKMVRQRLPKPQTQLHVVRWQ